MIRRAKQDTSHSFDSAQMLAEDAEASTDSKRRFEKGNKPVIRWVKGDGLDDPITKSAIAQATRLFGSKVDYCLATNGISADRVRNILEWASEPVEWWPVTPDDNPQLKELLAASGCLPARYGYWWKWFPERIRPDAPEWILDGDMVITAPPPWFEDWIGGTDGLRVSQDDRGQKRARWWRNSAAQKSSRDYKYGEYSDLIDSKLSLYSGLISLPPGMRYMPFVADLLNRQPLKPDHDGVNNMSEQGVMAVALQELQPTPIPLYEFPFAHAGADFLEYGESRNRRHVWGYHFTRSFVVANPHFEAMLARGELFSASGDANADRYRWLSGGSGQWGIPGWGMKEKARALVLKEAAAFAGKRVLDLGTSRGRLAASLADLGCTVTTIDLADRGATQNLAGLDVTVLIEDVTHYLERSNDTFDLIVVDLHGNTPEHWQTYGDLITARLAPKGKIVINNVELFRVEGWSAETGVKEFLEKLSSEWKIKLHRKPPPGIAVIRKRKFHL